MAHSKAIRDLVRKAYVFDAQSLEMAAAKAGVSLATVRRWKDSDKKNGNDWDKVKSANTLAGGSLEDVARSILTEFLMQFQSVNEQIKLDVDMKASAKAENLSRLADAFTKTVSASKKVLPETSQLATAMQVIQHLGKFIQEKHPKHLEAFGEILEPFGEELERMFG